MERFCNRIFQFPPQPYTMPYFSRKDLHDPLWHLMRENMRTGLPHTKVSSGGKWYTLQVRAKDLRSCAGNFQSIPAAPCPGTTPPFPGEGKHNSGVWCPRDAERGPAEICC